MRENRTNLRNAATGVVRLAGREEAVIAVESRDHAKNNGVSPKDQMSRGNFMNKATMRKSFFATILLFLCSLGTFGQMPYATQTSQIYYVWQNDVWVQNAKVEFTHDAKGNQIAKVEYRWQNNAWVEYSKDEYTYDFMGNVTSHKGYLWQNNAWVEHNKSEYAYDIKCYKKNAFGLDLGLGYGFGMYQDWQHFVNVYDTRIYHAFAFSLGVRYMHHFNRYFGADFVKINWAVPVGSGSSMQFMTGVRGNTPVFSKCMSAYGALRLGYGLGFTNPATNGVCFETELGLNFTRTFFMGVSYNFHDFNDRRQAVELRLGFNFGK
ncbi:MAG: DUF3836 domain-containing protein [Lentimicrobiaceae bacterium]|nr:DUF3836 domain-containing protein [Lentimicrobiaceae bacterium]